MPQPLINGVFVDREMTRGRDAERDSREPVALVVSRRLGEPQRECAEVCDPVAATCAPVTKPLDDPEERRDRIDRHVAQLL